LLVAVRLVLAAAQILAAAAVLQLLVELIIGAFQAVLLVALQQMEIMALVLAVVAIAQPMELLEPTVVMEFQAVVVVLQLHQVQELTQVVTAVRA
jgi:hypothetical protein